MRTALLLTTTAMLVLGCGGGSDGCDYPPAQGPAQPCCVSWGPDACGAGFFCAAFDGRTIATCYANGSRLDGQSCTANEQCGSMSCNITAGACRALGATCDPAVGCAPRPIGGNYACDPADSTCRPVGNGRPGALCNTDADCQSPLLCANATNRCEGELPSTYTACSTDAECTAWEGIPSCRFYAQDRAGVNYGYCTIRCDVGLRECPEGTRCVGESCALICTTAEDCPLPQLACVDRGDGPRCQGCIDSSQCRSGMTCVHLGTLGECR